MSPTRLRSLFLVAVVTGIVVWGLTRVWDASSPELPRVPVSAPLTLLLLALLLGSVALTARRRLSGRPGIRPLDRLVAARLVAFARASAWVGSTVAGGYAGFAVALVGDLDIDARRERVVLASLTAIAACLAVAMALVLERVLRVPPPPAESGADRPDQTA